jgi:hypothetical protein
MKRRAEEQAIGEKESKLGSPSFCRSAAATGPDFPTRYRYDQRDSLSSLPSPKSLHREEKSLKVGHLVLGLRHRV